MLKTSSYLINEAAEAACGRQSLNDLGMKGLLAVGVWSGVNLNRGMTVSGEPIEIDADHQLTQAVMMEAVSLAALNDLTSWMDRYNSEFSQAKENLLRGNTNLVANQVGLQILKSLA